MALTAFKIILWMLVAALAVWVFLYLVCVIITLEGPRDARSPWPEPMCKLIGCRP